MCNVRTGDLTAQSLWVNMAQDTVKCWASKHLVSVEGVQCFNQLNHSELVDTFQCRQCTYNVTFRRVRATIGGVEKQ